MSYSSFYSGNYSSSSDTFMKWNIAGPSLFGFVKSCFPYMYYSRKTLSSRLKLSSSVRKERLKAKVWEVEQMISSLEGNTWKLFLSTARIRMQENAFKYISSEGKNIYGMPWDCKSGHNSSGGNKALYFYLKNSWLWLLLVTFIIQVSRVIRTNFLYVSNEVEYENSMKDENLIVIDTEKMTEKIFLWKGAETTGCKVTLNR